MNHFSDIHQTWSTRYKKPSLNSFSFVNWDGTMKKQDLIPEERNVLKTVFQLKDEKLFKEKFDQAVNGDGQEWTRITTLHSSSLIALLCFYKIDNNNPLEYTIDGKKCIFTNSYFECQNDIKYAPRPSNIDVVLTGQIENTNEQVILFLESKFSEYLSHAKCEGISHRVYGDIYTKLVNRIDGLKIEEAGTWSISATPERPQAYCEGIKQMVSHFQGVRDGFIGSDDDKYNHIYLGEILFKFEKEVDTKNKKNNKNNFESYRDYYNSLAKRLNEINNDDRFIVLDEPLTYQNVFKDFKLDDSVQKFYGIGKK